LRRGGPGCHDRDFTPQLAYGTAKLENILYTKELHARYHAQGLSAAAFHPGAVATSFATDSDSFMRRIYSSRIGRAFMVSPEKGASQMVWLAETSPGTDWESGTYYEKNKPAKRTTPRRSTWTSPANSGTAPPNSSARRSAETGHPRPRVSQAGKPLTAKEQRHRKPSEPKRLAHQQAVAGGR
jgi:hypothetical protein